MQRPKIKVFGQQLFLGFVIKKVYIITHEVHVVNDIDELLDAPLRVQVLDVRLVQPEHNQFFSSSKNHTT